jgi:hypothetical protein
LEQAKNPINPIIQKNIGVSAPIGITNDRCDISIANSLLLVVSGPGLYAR